MQFWLKEMEIYYQKELGMNITDQAFYALAQHFMSARSHDYWSEDVVWERDENDVNRIKSFR